MKYFVSLLLTLALCCAALTGCGKPAAPIESDPDAGTVQPAENPPWEITGEASEEAGWDTMPLSQLVEECLGKDEEGSEARSDALYRRFAGWPLTVGGYLSGLEDSQAVQDLCQTIACSIECLYDTDGEAMKSAIAALRTGGTSDAERSIADTIEGFYQEALERHDR